MEENKPPLSKIYSAYHWLLQTAYSNTPEEVEDQVNETLVNPWAKINDSPLLLAALLDVSLPSKREQCWTGMLRCQQ